MRIVNGISFFVLLAILVLCFLNKRQHKFLDFIRGHIWILIILGIANGISFFLSFEPDDGQIVIEKGDYGDKEKQISLMLRQGEEEESYLLCVEPRQYTKEECERKMEEAFTALEKRIQGENSSLSEIRSDLNLEPDKQYPFEMEIRSSRYNIINEQGVVHNEEEELKSFGYTKEQWGKGLSVQLSITLWYGEIHREREYNLLVFEQKEDEKQRGFSLVKKALQHTLEQEKYERQIVIPSRIEGISIERTDENKLSPFSVWISGFALCILLVLREKEQEKTKEEERLQCLKRSYPWFVNELVLLMGAGMQVRTVFFTLIKEYESHKEEKKKDYREPLIQELSYGLHNLELGISEEKVYYQLGRRLKLPQYIKIMTLLEQNVKRGSKGFIDTLEQEELHALEERKNLAKKMGEEAGTKLLGPMIILLLVILLMIMLPAFMSFA